MPKWWKSWTSGCPPRGDYSFHTPYDGFSQLLSRSPRTKVNLCDMNILARYAWEWTAFGTIAIIPDRYGHMRAFSLGNVLSLAARGLRGYHLMNCSDTTMLNKSMTTLFEGHHLALQYLVPNLLKLYVDIEFTGSHTQVRDLRLWSYWCRIFSSQVQSWRTEANSIQQCRLICSWGPSCVERWFWIFPLRVLPLTEKTTRRVWSTTLGGEMTSIGILPFNSPLRFGVFLQFYDKFNIRHNIAELLEYLWDVPSHHNCWKQVRVLMMCCWPWVSERNSFVK